MRWRWTREEEFLCSSTRAPWHIELADAVTKDGWILGRKMLTLHDSGAYARFSPYGLTKHSFHHTGAYTIPNLSLRRLCRLHEPGADDGDAGLRRDLGLVRHGDAHEQSRQVLGVDPWELRLKNANRIGDTSPNGITYTDPSTVPVVKALAEGMGVELSADLRSMSRDTREGDLLPQHLVAQIGNPEDH